MLCSRSWLRSLTSEPTPFCDLSAGISLASIHAPLAKRSKSSPGLALRSRDLRSTPQLPKRTVPSVAAAASFSIAQLVPDQASGAAAASNKAFRIARKFRRLATLILHPHLVDSIHESGRLTGSSGESNRHRPATDSVR